jgi:hypothetical protein
MSKASLILGLVLAPCAAMLAENETAFAQNGFAWACAATTASYNAVTTCAPYAYNSRGGAVNVTRTGVGTYEVNFVGLGGRGHFGGTVQVTAYSPSAPGACHVVDWNASADAGGADFIAFVACSTFGGTPLDSRYDILVEWLGQ